ncbi:nitronate monooxygenase [Pseudomonas aeruginosa]|nr:nitronate monooxygenase [Pseudomonas aeruginosa]MBN0085833.1 nitronate monooxygenase [Pseudomonas aeruginosa]MBN0141962.1 nitronate monooxygenase [Pseudomonas aeruginosa]MBN0295985.1 nitronate monooxygenase [Pseudomonas aeruginosa]MBN0316277.1 nitronate monooxygenase [Pseudomonas aeruginosa]
MSCVETSGASPEGILPALRDAGIKVLHKVPAVCYARSAERLGVDAVIVVGNDCGGHPGTYGISSMVQAPHASKEISIPLVIGGGMGTGRQLAATLMWGQC